MFWEGGGEGFDFYIFYIFLYLSSKLWGHLTVTNLRSLEREINVAVSFVVANVSGHPQLSRPSISCETASSFIMLNF